MKKKSVCVCVCVRERERECESERVLEDVGRVKAIDFHFDRISQRNRLASYFVRGKVIFMKQNGYFVPCALAS